MQMNKDFLADTTKFFDEFVDAFKAFDGAVIAQRYFSTFIAVHADGTLESFTSSSSIARYFQGYLDGYYSNGCRSCAYKALEAVPISESCILATVSWELYNGSGEIVSGWKESYSLAYVDKRLLVFASIDHAA